MIKNLEDFKQFRCPTCNKLLFKYRLKGSLSLEIKCTRCGNNFSSILGETTGNIQE